MLPNVETAWTSGSWLRYPSGKQFISSCKLSSSFPSSSSSTEYAINPECRKHFAMVCGETSA
jgi:hypothetical protein